MKINVTCVQMHPKLLDVKENLAKMANFIETIMTAKPQTDLIVFPELATTGYECGKNFSRLAENIQNGESIKQISALAKSYQVHVIFGFPERDEAIRDVIYNSNALIGPDGGLIGTYRKVHLFDKEKMYFRPGCSYPVFETKIGKIGSMICWDSAFPEVARIYALKGVELLVTTSNWEKPYSRDWDLTTAARALDNCIYLAAANRVGQDLELDFFGHSRIYSPLGEIIAALDEDIEGFISAELDYNLPIKYRKEYYTYFKDRRPDSYDLLTKKY